MAGYNLDRFKSAQDGGIYEEALKEARNGEKRNHWMWFIFPQMKGLGTSRSAELYGIENPGEAKAYLEDPVLGARLREICAALLEQPQSDPEIIFGFPDYLKLRSSMTLFDLVSPKDVFADILDKFYHGESDQSTLSIINSQNGNGKAECPED